MIKSPTNKKLKVIDKNITNFQSGALNYVFVPVSSSAKMEVEFDKEINKKWINLDHHLKLWKSYPRNFKPGTIKLHSVQSNATIIFAYCLNDNGTVNKEMMDKCIKEILHTVKYNEGSMNFSKKLAIAEDVEEFEKFIEDTFVAKNISSYLFN